MHCLGWGLIPFSSYYQTIKLCIKLAEDSEIIEQSTKLCFVVNVYVFMCNKGQKQLYTGFWYV